MIACALVWGEGAVDWYSRLISWLKVLLPLAALILLSTLFLLSRGSDFSSRIPFADAELQERLRDQVVRAPFFSAATRSGDRVSVSASRLTMMPEDDKSRVEVVQAQIDMVEGNRITVRGDLGVADTFKNTLSLTGNVIVTTSNGYEIMSERLDSNLGEATLESPAPVTGQGPLGTLDAGSMILENPPDGPGGRMLFTNRVKLIYDPQNLEE